MKFDTLAQRIIQENQPGGSSPEEHQAVLDAHAKALARNPAQPIWVEFAPASDIPAKIDADRIKKRSGELGYQNVEDPQVDGHTVGLSRYHDKEYFKVINQFHWADFKKSMDLSAGVDYVEHGNPRASSAFPSQEESHDYTKEMRSGVGRR